MRSVFLANVIWVLHIILVLWIVITPFTNNEPMLVLHVMVIPFLAMHWITGNDTCALTLMERYLRGCDSKDSFFHNLVSPVYKIDDKVIGNIAWVAALALWSVSLSKVLKRPAMVKDVFMLRPPQAQKTVTT